MSDDLQPKEAKWYVIHTYSGYENKVKTTLETVIENRGLHEMIQEVSVPMEEQIEVKDGKKKVAMKKIYPGYVLVKMVYTEEIWYIVRNTRGVTGFVGPYTEQVRVVGEAAKPQTLPYKQQMTLLDVMIAVGGITEFADGNRATIVRASESNKQYSVRLKDLVKRGDVSANVDMKPGDILIIPQSWF